MEKINGYNPLRWDCSISGCFNKLKRPKIEMFADCFPGKINFGDIDGIVEINGHALILEFKDGLQDIPSGQKIMFQRLTKNSCWTVICVDGNAETMEIKNIMIWFNSETKGWNKSNLEKLKIRICKWVKWAQQNK